MHDLHTDTAGSSASPDRHGTIPAGMVAWNGGESAPEDWIGYGPGGEASWPDSNWPSTVLYRDGTTGSPEPKVGRWRHKGAHGWDGGNYDIIAYTPKPTRTDTPAGDAEARARKMLAGCAVYPDDIISYGCCVDMMLAFAVEAVAAERERAAQKCLSVSGLIGAAAGSLIDSALREAAAAIREQAK